MTPPDDETSSTPTLRPASETGVASDFRTAMAQVCTPVSIVTTMTADGPFGTTVSAFNSLSMDPPMILVALDRSSDLLAAVERQKAFGVNVLAHGQDQLALNFARKGGSSKFDGVDWSVVADQPCVTGGTVFVAAELTELVDGGDHMIALGTITHVQNSNSAPLTYHSRAFGTHVSPLDGQA